MIFLALFYLADFPSLTLIKVEAFLGKALSFIFFLCARLRFALVRDRLGHPVAPPRLRPGLLSLCSVTSFRRFPVFFPHKKSKTFSLRSYVLCGFICARLRIALVWERLGHSVAPPRLRPGLLSLCSVTSFRRFPVSFPHKKSKTFSLRSYVLCGFICARLRIALVWERLGRTALNNPHKLENSQNF